VPLLWPETPTTSPPDAGQLRLGGGRFERPDGLLNGAVALDELQALAGAGLAAATDVAAGAISHDARMRERWSVEFFKVGQIFEPLDKNEAEQLVKQVALGRKNWMFNGSVAAGSLAADLMSLVSSAHRNDLDVFVYVKDVLDRLLAGETNYDTLRPDVWKQTHPEAIRIYRVEERQARANAKAVKRARRRIAKRG